MRSLAVSFAAWCLFGLLTLFLALPDGVIMRALRLAKRVAGRIDPTGQAGVALGDAERIFAKPAAGAQVRRMWREARPEQVLAILKGALRS